MLQQLGLAGGGTFLLVLLGASVAYLWNNRRLPDRTISRTAERGPVGAILDAVGRRLVARRPLVRAGFFFTLRVLARSVQNRLSIGIPLAVAIAVATVSLRVAGLSASLDFSSAPIAVLAVQLLFVAALVIGFRHSVRVPADLRARWLFHLIRPANHSAYMAGAKRAALLKLVVPVLVVLLPLTFSHWADKRRSCISRTGCSARSCSARRPCWDIADCPSHPVTFRRWT